MDAPVTRLVFALLLSLWPTVVSAQTLDTVTLSDGSGDGSVALTIVRNPSSGTQQLVWNGQVIEEAVTITRGPSFTNRVGATDGALFYLLLHREDCPPTPIVVQAVAGEAVRREPLSSGRLGAPCATLDVAATDRHVQIIAPPDLYRDGLALAYDLDLGLQVYGAVRYAPQPRLGWEHVTASLETGTDLYAHTPVFDALQTLWGADLFLFAQHLASRSAPATQDGLIYQPGCILAQCAFAIGLLAVDPASETVYSAYLNEGAPDIRPPLDQWSASAMALYEAWRSGELR